MAKTFWPGEDAVGRRFRYYNREGSFEVIGVARDVKAVTLGETPVPMLYTPFRDLPDGGITIFVHTGRRAWTDGGRSPSHRPQHR